MREHGTRACYVHGPNPGSTPGGCRCEPCRAAAAAAERERKRRDVPTLVSAAEARAHLEELAKAGVGLKTVAKVSGVAHGALYKIVYGMPSVGRPPSKRIRPATRDAILAVTPAAAADGSRVDATRTLAQVEELVAAGMPKANIAQTLGQKGPGLQLAKAGDTVSARHARTIAELHRQWLAGELTIERRSRHGSSVVTLTPPERDDTPPATDDRDDLLMELVEILEARIDQNGWRRRAACIGKPPWLFFPQRGETAQAARAICATCPVSAECLEAHRGERAGVWGGTVPLERRRARGVDVRCSECAVPVESTAVGRVLCEDCRAASRAKTQQAWRDRRRQEAAS